MRKDPVSPIGSHQIIRHYNCDDFSKIPRILSKYYCVNYFYIIIILLIHIILYFIFCHIVNDSGQGAILILIMEIIFTIVIPIYTKMQNNS